MRTRAVLATLAAVFLIAASLAHGLTGWPHFAAHLREAGLDEDNLGALASGWYFGSLSMFAFGVIAAFTASDLWRRRPTSAAPLRIVGTALVVFGMTALVAHGHSPHYVGFIGIGLVALGASWPIRS